MPFDPLSADEQPLDLDAVASAIVARRLEVPVIFMLELHRPLAHLGSQAMLVGTPLVAPLLGLRRWQQLQATLADPAAYERFLQLIEHKSRTARAAAEPAGRGG